MSTLRIAADALQALRAHGERAYPRECCGALLGRMTPEGWAVETAVPASNACAGDPHRRYEIAPAELAALLGEARRRGLEIAGFYHSHPDCPAQWSATDLAEAHWVGCCTVITQVAEGRAAETRAFLLAGTTEEDKRFAELRILPDGPGAR